MDSMEHVKVGDKVVINLENVYKNGMDENEEQYQKLRYIEKHPNKVYTVVGINNEFAAPFILDDAVLVGTTFYEDELIVQK